MEHACACGSVGVGLQINSDDFCLTAKRGVTGPKTGQMMTADVVVLFWPGVTLMGV